MTKFKAVCDTVRGIYINDQDRKDNGEGVATGVVKENERCSDSVEEKDDIKVGSRKRKRCDSVSALTRLIGRCRHNSNH